MKRKQVAALLAGMFLVTTAHAGTYVDLWVTVNNSNGYSLSGATAKLYGGSYSYGGMP